MTAQPLIDCLLPANRCRHFDGIFANACTYDPDHRLAPGGFGGAIGSVNDVRLVIVIAEPAYPPDDVNYRSDRGDMINRSLRMFIEGMEGEQIKRSGRPSPFHQYLLAILEHVFSGQSPEQKLKHTWATNAVLCSASVLGGRHPILVENTCTIIYLAPQLNLLKEAFVLIPVGKAHYRLVAACLRFDAVGCYPIASVSNDDKDKS